ncbi:hypothetical protein [Engelhardtia mirabilis]|uniref:Uncharacterized protein n=1 Tax=Engelhardtia mirabilis TaxID=2528011 RepID=A0A518BGR8_9BACT|nr:hypothetical protein Pla133_12380 [Planctomycetes bacterium Pla133]QDV00499.1 hypothetical protein Pla86_12380 [Planctomycetes bacterium Pla86]
MHRSCTSLAICASIAVALAAPASGQLMHGYLGVPNEAPSAEYGGGFSMYVAAWPLLEEWPGNRFQTGLFGTWMFAQKPERELEGKLYSDIEGGLGWWRDTRFATATPKFIMGGVTLNFATWANGPGAGKGRDWDEPRGKYGVAQLSPWVIWPPDGLNLAQGTCGELFGYGYLPLPLTEPKATTAGHPVPTGDQSWTLFLNTANFKGPVAFFTPYFFSQHTIDRPDLAGIFLDAMPSDPGRALQMETQYIPATLELDRRERAYARSAPTRFPLNGDDASVLVHRITSYKRLALWDAVETWFDGGEPASGAIAPEAGRLHTIPGHGWSTWKIHADDTPNEEQRTIAWSSFAEPVALDDHTFGYRWSQEWVARPKQQKDAPLFTLPEFFELEDGDGGPIWNPVRRNAVPVRRDLERASFVPTEAHDPAPYTTPEDGCWSEPGPVAGPFEAELGDGSVVTYHWYRFADQPALLNADLSDEEREQLQDRVELLHRAWTRDREYLPPPDLGELASLDPALIVEPPKGLEVGYVPIVTRQGRR